MLEKYINYFTNDLPNKTSLFLLCAAFYFLLHSHVFGPLWSFRTIPPFSWAPQAPQQAASTLTLKNPQLASSLLGLQLSSPLFYVSWLVPREILCFQNAPTFLICIQWVSFHSHEFRVKNQCVHCGKVSMLIMPPVPNQVIRWIWKYTRILWVAQHLLPFFFFFQIQFFPSCGKEPLLASVSLNDFSGSHMGFEQEAEHERLPLSKKQLVRIQQSSKDGVYEKLSDWFQLTMIQLSIRV